MNDPTAMSHKYWTKALDVMETSDDRNTVLLAGIVRDLMEINKHDPKTIDYMNAKAAEYLDRAEQSKR